MKASVISGALLSSLCHVLVWKREITSSAPQQEGKGGVSLTLTATAVSHHKDLSFVCSNKENSNQKTDGYRLLPLSPAAEINDRDKHAHTHTHRQFLVSIVSFYLLSLAGPVVP